MGYVMAMGHCFACKQVFSFNPHLVPSLRDAHNERQPICRSCVTLANELRKAKNMPLFTPPDGAYEPMPEEEL